MIRIRGITTRIGMSSSRMKWEWLASTISALQSHQTNRITGTIMVLVVISRRIMRLAMDIRGIGWRTGVDLELDHKTPLSNQKSAHNYPETTIKYSATTRYYYSLPRKKTKFTTT